jgi:fucose 4-O-acetylase-like acetyltransferase
VRPMAAQQVARDDRATRLLVVIALIIVLLTDFGYLLIIRAQATTSPDQVVPFVATYLALMTAMLGVSLWNRAPVLRARPALRAGAAGGLIVLGILGLWSIGLALVVAAGLAIAATVRTASMGPSWSGVPVKLAAAVAAVVILVAGYEVSSRLIQCPSQGEAGGTGGLVFSFSWDCVNGHAQFH